MTLFLALVLILNDAQIVQKFEAPNAENELQNIVAITIDLEMNVYALDAGANKVFVWRSDGSFVQSFGRRGEGPGEFNQPIQLCVTDTQIIVWQMNGRMSFFDHNGAFQYQVTIASRMPKKFTLLDDGHVLIGFRQMIDGDVFAVFENRADNGDLENEVLRLTNPGFVRASHGEGNAEINAYMPDLDLQTWEGKTYIGFGSEPVIYQLDASGTVTQKLSFQIPTNVPTEEEKEHYLAMSFPADGGRISLRDLPNLKIHFDRPKAYFTQFTVKAGKVLFLRTPIGSLDGIGDGYAAGDYFVNDLTTGRLLAKGSFAFPEDSQVTLRDGQVIAAITTEESYDLCRLHLNNF